MASQVFKAGSDGRVTAEYDPLTGVLEILNPTTGKPTRMADLDWHPERTASAASASVVDAQGWIPLQIGAGFLGEAARIRIAAGGGFDLAGTITGTFGDVNVVAYLPAGLPVEPWPGSRCAIYSTNGAAVLDVNFETRTLTALNCAGSQYISLDGAFVKERDAVAEVINPDNFLPVVRVYTDGQEIPHPSLDTYITGRISVDGNSSGFDDVALVSVGISGHGNSTWGAPKKPLKLKFSAATSLLGMPADKSWRLLANYLDRTLIRNAFAFEMMRRIYTPWTPRNEFCEVYVDDVYQGVYQLTEPVKAGANRLPVTLAKSSDTGLNATGAFMLEISERLESEGGNGFRTAISNVPIQWDDPDPPSASQITYLQGYINAFESALMGDQWLDPVSGYAKYVDMQSWADWYLVSELTRNQDSAFYSSVKLFKTRDTSDAPGVLHLGPLWDSDMSLGNGGVVGGRTEDWCGPYNGWHTRDAVWLGRMLSDPVFLSVVKARWELLKSAIYDKGGAIQWAKNASLYIAPAADSDAERWGFCPDSGGRFRYVLKWLALRVKWIDANL